MIPKIIHRTIPSKETDLMKNCWESVQKYCSKWELRTHYDLDEYDIVGEYLDLCPRGAFKADLIRLEVLYKFGGIYLDSDVEIYQPLDRLLDLDAFVVEEDNLFPINAVMGSIPENPLILEMINMSIDIIKSNRLTPPFLFRHNDIGANLAFGPHVVKSVIYNKVNKITTLPSYSFDTYYQLRHLAPKNTIPYGKHWYAGSWL